jgi:MFS family permease
VRRLPLFYGWIVVFSVALLLAASSGARFAFGVFLKPVAETFDWNRADLSFAITINLVLGGLLQPAAGLLVDRLGARIVGAVGMGMLGLSFVALAFATELWHFYLFYGVVGAVGVATTSSVLSAKLVGSWFVARRGTALSFSSSGTAIGQLLIVPFATWMLVNYGFQAGFETIAAISLLMVAPLAWLAIRNEPSELGQEPDGAASRAGSRPVRRTDEGVDVRTALRSLVFWQLSFGLIVCGVTMSFPSTHLMPYAMDMHVAEMTASSALGLAGALSLPAAILVGWLADRFGRGRVLAMVYALRGVTYVFLLSATSEAVWFVAAFTLGLSWTGTVPLSSALAADAFGRKHLGLITGTMVMGMWVAAGVAAFLAGLIYDQMHSYHLALVGNGVLGFAAAAICLTIVGERALPFATRRAALA